MYTKRLLATFILNETCDGRRNARVTFKAQTSAHCFHMEELGPGKRV